MRRFQRIIEPIDDYLSSVGLYRKVTAKDGSCLFRAVAEQVFHTQALHLKVRESCVKYMENNVERFAPFVEGPFDQHLQQMKNPKEWAGQVEISALSLMYKRDFCVYQDPGIGAFNVTQNGFKEKVVLCFSHGSHYDSVFSKRFQENAAICQSVIYELLYRDIFKLSKQVDEAVDILRASGKKQMKRDGSYGNDGMREGENAEGDHVGGERDPRERFGRYHEEKKRPPLPYRVAKALDPEIYRNVEFDTWNEARKEQQQQDYLLASGMQYIPGDKCQVFLDDPKKLYSAHIQDVTSNNGPVTVFIEDLGEKHTIPMKNLKPLDSVSPHRPWSPLGVRNYKNMGGYYQKFTNGIPSDSEMYRMKSRVPRKCAQMNQNLNQLYGCRFSSPSPPNGSQGYDPGQQQPPFVRPLMPHERQSPRPTSPYQRGRGSGRCNHNMHASMSQEEYEEKRALEDSLALFELQDRDSSSFPALPGHQGGRINAASPVNLWEKFRKDGRKSTSPIQRINTPSPVHMFEGRGTMHNDGLQTQFQEMSVHDNGRHNSGKNQYGKECSQSTNHQQFRENGGVHHDVNSTPPPAKWHSSDSTLSTSGSNPCPSAGNTPSPPTVPMMPSYSAPMPIGIPLYPLVIPLTDNLTGPVNASATASRDPSGYDLPLSDVPTLRYYYNLGIEYHHRLYLLQMHQWQQQQQQQQQTQHQQPFHQPPDMAAPHTQHQQSMVQSSSSSGSHYSPEGTISNSSNIPEDESDEGMRHRICPQNGQQGLTVVSNQEPASSPSSLKNNERFMPNSVHQPYQQQQQQLPLPTNAVYFTFPPRGTPSSLSSTHTSDSNLCPEQQQQQQQQQQQPLPGSPSPSPIPQRSLGSQQQQQQQNSDCRKSEFVGMESGTNNGPRQTTIATPLRPSMPLRIPTPRSEARPANEATCESPSPSPCLPSCPPDMHPSGMARTLATPTRRKLPYDVISPGVFPMSPFPVLNSTNLTLPPPVLSPTGPSLQPYYVESPAGQHLHPQLPPLPQPPPPPMQAAPSNTFFNPHANSPAIQSDPYAHVNYHPPPAPAPAPPPPPAPGTPGTYQYPVQGQWQPAFPYGSPVKVPTVAYGQSPPITYMTNSAPAQAPALYIPTTH